MIYKINFHLCCLFSIYNGGGLGHVCRKIKKKYQPFDRVLDAPTPGWTKSPGVTACLDPLCQEQGAGGQHPFLLVPGQALLMPTSKRSPGAEVGTASLESAELLHSQAHLCLEWDIREPQAAVTGVPLGLWAFLCLGPACRMWCGAGAPPSLDLGWGWQPWLPLHGPCWTWTFDGCDYFRPHWYQL